MATTYKSFLASDIATTRTLLNESIPLTGALISGTYADQNIKNMASGIYQSIYDYPYLSSSANYIMDIYAGYSNSSPLSSSSNVQNEKKINIYNQMAQVLMGNDHTGSIVEFDEDGNILAGGTKIREAIFINFARLLVKDEIRKGSFTMSFGTAATQALPFAGTSRITITDSGAQNDFKVNSPVGEYGILSASSGEAAGSTSGLCGLIFYQAGIAVLTASIFMTQPTGKIASSVGMTPLGRVGGGTMQQTLTGSSITGSADAVRNRIYNIAFSNTTELNSTIYFCRVNHNEFNYSSNPTYLTGSRIRVKQNSSDQPMAYISTIGLYSSDNALLAVAKVSEPLKKTTDTDITLRVRTDW
jgi:hypothetical protein